MIEQIIDFVREDWLPLFIIVLVNIGMCLEERRNKRMITTQKYREGLIKK